MGWGDTMQRNRLLFLLRYLQILFLFLYLFLFVDRYLAPVTIPLLESNRLQLHPSDINNNNNKEIFKGSACEYQEGT